jgi:hypothetical protein
MRRKPCGPSRTTCGAADVLADVMVWPVPVWAVSVWAVPLSAALASAAAATAAEMAGEMAAASLAVRWPLMMLLAVRRGLARLRPSSGLPFLAPIAAPRLTLCHRSRHISHNTDNDPTRLIRRKYYRVAMAWLDSILSRAIAP